MDPSQKQWFDLTYKLGEKEARKVVIEELKEAIKCIEKGGFPDIFGVILPDRDNKGNTKDFIYTVSVTLSHPWPG